MGALMADWGHVLDRFVIHVFSSGMVTLLLRYALYQLERRVLTARLGGYMWYLLPAVLGPLLIFLREPLDVLHGGWWIKSYIDPVGWAVGALASTWLSRALCMRDQMAATDIRHAKGRRREAREQATVRTRRP